MSSATAVITFSETNGTYTYTVGSIAGYTTNPSSSSVTVTGAALNVAISFVSVTPATYSVAFSESGLPTGTSWSVTLAGNTQTSTTSTISFVEPNGSYAYSVGAVTGFTASPSSGSVPVAGAPVTQTVTFTPLPPATYPVTFTETGLASGLTWSVTFNGTKSAAAPAQLVFPGIHNGTFPFTAASPGYSASPASGSITVSGFPVTRSIAFTPNPGARTLYNVTFSETGLPGGSLWGVECGLSASAGFVQTDEGKTVQFVLPNGTYFWLEYGAWLPPNYLATPANGNITVNGHAVTQAVTFTKLIPTSAKYGVTFTERGIRAGASWSVMFNGTGATSTGTSIVFNVRNGTYDFSASAPGYLAAPSFGNLGVDGAPVSQTLSFTTAYAVTFSETGLPASAIWWSLALNGTAASARGSTIVINEVNGTYAFSIGIVLGYGSTPSSGTITVAGTSVSKAILFTPDAYKATFTESGLPLGDVWVVLVTTTPFAQVVGQNTAGSDIVVPLSNGNYTWETNSFSSSGGNSGYGPSPVFGFVRVNGTSVSQAVRFTAASGLYIVVFDEAHAFVPVDGGVPTGANWSVTLGGVTESTGGFTILFTEPNGTYAYSITPPPGYVAAPAAGRLIVNNSSGIFFTGAAFVLAYFGPAGIGVFGHPPAGGAPFGPLEVVTATPCPLVVSHPPARLGAVEWGLGRAQ